ncbi:MAG: YbbR-like domain-containing protein [Candidatus Eisenbacteria bacterium]|nr:YbbR-like domain-containing protein [Candidatus Eisenbacteria bacterium]
MNVLRGWLFDNLGLKFTALLLAVAVYLNVYTDRSTTMLLSFPVEFTDLPDSLALSGPAPAVVQAQMRGTWKQLIGMRVREPRLKLSLLGAGTGRFSRALTPADLPMSEQGVTVENLIGPRMIEIDIDGRTTRELPIAARVVGVPAAGFEFGGFVRLDPPFVKVTGAAKSLGGLDSLVLAPLDLSGRRDTVRAELAIADLPDWCTSDPATVHVKLALTRR